MVQRFSKEEIEGMKQQLAMIYDIDGEVKSDYRGILYNFKLNGKQDSIVIRYDGEVIYSKSGAIIHDGMDNTEPFLSHRFSELGYKTFIDTMGHKTYIERKVTHRSQPSIPLYNKDIFFITDQYNTDTKINMMNRFGDIIRLNTKDIELKISNGEIKIESVNTEIGLVYIITVLNKTINKISMPNYTILIDDLGNNLLNQGFNSIEKTDYIGSAGIVTGFKCRLRRETSLYDSKLNFVNYL